MEREQALGSSAIISSARLGRVFITGATGIIGSHLTEAVLAAGAERVVCLTRSIHPESYFVTAGLATRVVQEPGDICSETRLREIMAEHDITTIFHLAAQALVIPALHNPLNTIRTNILGTANVLEAARLARHITAVVVAASDKAYGNARPPYHEDMALDPQHPYDASKASTDMLCRTYARAYGLPVVSLRCANVYGPGDTHSSRIIPGLMKAMLTGEELQIRSDGTLVREYVYAADVAAGYLAAVSNIEAARGQAFNLGSGVVLSVRDLLEQVPVMVGRTLRYAIANTAHQEILRQSLDSTKAMNYLGWSPQWTFPDGVRETYRWYERVLSPARAAVAERI